MSIGRLDFGIFLAPFHPVRENPTLSLQRDLELIEGGFVIGAALRAIHGEVVRHADEQEKQQRKTG